MDHHQFNNDMIFRQKQLVHISWSGQVRRLTIPHFISMFTDPATGNIFILRYTVKVEGG